jgi:hypothetical protein
MDEALDVLESALQTVCEKKDVATMIT